MRDATAFTLCAALATHVVAVVLALPAQNEAPQILRLGVEDVVAKCIEHHPRPGIELAVELTRRPTGVAAKHANSSDLVGNVGFILHTALKALRQNLGAQPE